MTYYVQEWAAEGCCPGSGPGILENRRQFRSGRLGWLCDGGVIQGPKSIHSPETVEDSRDPTNSQPVLDIL